MPPQTRTTAKSLIKMLQATGELVAVSGDTSVELQEPVAVDRLAAHSLGRLSFLTTVDGDTLNELARVQGYMLLLPVLPEELVSLAKSSGGCWVQCRDPRLAFAMCLERAFEPKATEHICETALISQTAIIAPGSSIGAFCNIEPGVVLGSHCQIASHVSVASGTTLGHDVRIGSGTRLGGPGFGYQRSADGTPRRFPQMGDLQIADHCEIGENVTINRGALSTTTIGAHVKIDDQVYVAHNVVIGPRTLVMAGTRVMGSARIGADVDLNPGCLIAQGVHVSDGCVIGMGAVVLEDVPPRTFAAGNPARRLGSATGRRPA